MAQSTDPKIPTFADFAATLNLAGLRHEASAPSWEEGHSIGIPSVVSPGWEDDGDEDKEFVYTAEQLAQPPLFDLVFAAVRERMSTGRKITKKNLYALMQACVTRVEVSVTDDVVALHGDNLVRGLKRQGHSQAALHAALLAEMWYQAGQQGETLAIAAVRLTPRRAFIEAWDTAKTKWTTIDLFQVKSVQVTQRSFADYALVLRPQEFAHPVEARAFQNLAGVV